HQDLALDAVPARDASVAALADDEAALKIERRAVALAGVRAHELGRLAGRDLVQIAPADVDEIVKAVGLPERALAEGAGRGEPLGIFRFEDRVEGVAHAPAPRCFVLSSTPARSSWSLKNVIESLSPQPRPRASSSCCSASAAIIIGTWYSRPSSVARPTSFRSSRSAKFTSSKAPGNTVLGIMSFSTRPWPNELLASASSSTSGATPALTPRVMPSAMAMREHAETMLCTSLATVPQPIPPTKVTLSPMASSTGLTRL